MRDTVHTFTTLEQAFLLELLEDFQRCPYIKSYFTHLSQLKPQTITQTMV